MIVGFEPTRCLLRGPLKPPCLPLSSYQLPSHLLGKATAMGSDFRLLSDCRHQPKVLYKILMSLRDKQDCFINFNTSSIAPT